MVTVTRSLLRILRGYGTHTDPASRRTGSLAGGSPVGDRIHLLAADRTPPEPGERVRPTRPERLRAATGLQLPRPQPNDPTGRNEPAAPRVGLSVVSAGRPE